MMLGILKICWFWLIFFYKRIRIVYWTRFPSKLKMAREVYQKVPIELPSSPSTDIYQVADDSVLFNIHQENCRFDK